MLDRFSDLTHLEFNTNSSAGDDEAETKPEAAIVQSVSTTQNENDCFIVYSDPIFHLFVKAEGVLNDTPPSSPKTKGIPTPEMVKLLLTNNQIVEPWDIVEIDTSC